MWTINASVTWVLISLTGLGVGFYVAIVVAGTSSYACPFQTPTSMTLRGLWKKFRRGILSCIVHFKRTFVWNHRVWNQRVRPLLRFRSQSTTIPLENVWVQRSEPWLRPKELDAIRRTNTNDVRCVSWILRSITDPEALDATIRLAGVIWWFDDGINVDPSYDLVVSTFEACLDSTGKLYPGSRDRAYYTGRAMLRIHTLAMRKFEEFAETFLLPITKYQGPTGDPDLERLLWINVARSAKSRVMRLLHVRPGHTLPHSQWISNVLLHFSWANRTPLDFDYIFNYISGVHEIPILTDYTVPLNASLNRLLVWCIFFGSPVEEEALKVQDKSYENSCFRSKNCSQHSSPVIA